MWQAVRRELGRLEWDVTDELSGDLVSDWRHTVSTLMELRRQLGPVAVADPMSMAAIATAGAMRTRDVTPTRAPSLHAVRQALADVAEDIGGIPAEERDRHVVTTNHVAYELMHWARIRVTDDRVSGWLLAGETSLDQAIHRQPARSTTGDALASWREALAAVQPLSGVQLVARSVALGHVALLHLAYTLVDDARRTGALPDSFSGEMLVGIRDLARAHQSMLRGIDAKMRAASETDRAVMLTLGTAVRRLTRPDVTEPATVRLDALLRSGVGDAVVVANLTDQGVAKPVAGRINRLALEYLAEPRMLRPTGRGAATSDLGSGGPAGMLPRALPSRAVWSPESLVAPGTVLPGSTVTALCNSRDLGVAAATGDAADPPQILRGIDPSQWPELVMKGRQAVAELVSSVVPIVYAQTRHAWNAEDLRGEMFVELMRAAYRFDPERIGPDRWPHYAWVTIERGQRQGVDAAGVMRGRGQSVTFVPLGGIDPSARTPAPEASAYQQQSLAAISDALTRLPLSLQRPLRESMQGRPARSIGEDLGVSERTARRRIQEARDRVRNDLARYEDDGATVPNVTDPVLERSQRLHDEARPLSLAPDPRRGVDRGR